MALPVPSRVPNQVASHLRSQPRSPLRGQLYCHARPLPSVIDRSRSRITRGVVSTWRPRWERIGAEAIRLAAAGVAAFLLVLSVGAVGVWNAGSDAPADTAVVHLERGDTLWSLAERVAPSSDPAVVVRQIERLNGLTETGVVRAGESLVVPMNSR